MKKVAFRNAEFMANLPPHRFAPGDVVEIDDAWADQLIQRGIAVKAKADARTALELRAASRPATPDDGGAAERATRREVLMAELNALDRVDAPGRPLPPIAEGHFSDMVTREAAPDAAPDAAAGGHDAKPAAKSGDRK